MAKRRAANKEYALLKLGNACARCGSKKNLEFDHIDPKSKTMVIADMLSHSRKRLDVELKKCQLLCADCHNDKSIIDRGQKKARGTHGTISAARYCNCAGCRSAKTKAQAVWRAKRKLAIGM